MQFNRLLRPVFGIGRDYMGTDGMSKAAAFLGGINGSTDDIVDPFLGSDIQTVPPPPRPLVPAHQPPQAPAPLRPIIEPTQPVTQRTYIPPTRVHHPPTPISTLLAFKKQVNTDAAQEKEALYPQEFVPMDDFVQESWQNQVDHQQQQSLLYTNSQQSLEELLAAELGIQSTLAPTEPSNPVRAQPRQATTSRPTTTNQRTKGYVHKACVNCKISHVACDVGRPCQRCIRSGKTSSCIDAQRKKRGRPTSMTKTPSMASTSSSESLASSSSCPPPKKRSRSDSPPSTTTSYVPIAAYPSADLSVQTVNNEMAEINNQLLHLQSNLVAAATNDNEMAITQDVLQAVTALSMLLPATEPNMNAYSNGATVAGMEGMGPAYDAAMAAAFGAVLEGLKTGNGLPVDGTGFQDYTPMEGTDGMIIASDFLTQEAMITERA